MKKFSLFSYGASILWALVVLALCAVPSNEIPDWNALTIAGADKIGHAFLFFVFAILLQRDLLRQSSSDQPAIARRVNPQLLTLVISLLYGLLLETLQGTIFQGRSADPLDLAANLCGTFLGLYFFRALARSPGRNPNSGTR